MFWTVIGRLSQKACTVTVKRLGQLCQKAWTVTVSLQPSSVFTKFFDFTRSFKTVGGETRVFSPTNHSVPISHVCLKGSKVTGCAVVPCPGHRHERPAEGASDSPPPRRVYCATQCRPDGAGRTSKTFTFSVSPIAWQLGNTVLLGSPG